LAENEHNQGVLEETEILVDALKPRLHAVVVCLSHSWGGLEQVAVSDSLDLGALGLSVQVMCLEGSPCHEHLVSRPEVKVVPLGFRPRNYFDLKLRAEILRLVAGGANLIHSHQTSLLGSIVPWLWRREGVVAIATRHMMNQHYKTNFLHRAIYGRLDAFLVMSETLRKNVLDTHVIQARRVRVVNLGLDYHRFDPSHVEGQAAAIRTTWGASKNTLVIGLVGRIDPAKGQGTFIKAAAGLMKDPNQRGKLKFVIVGDETPGIGAAYLDSLKQMAKQFHIEEEVVFAGFREDIPQVMRALDICVMPSRQETFGLVAIEAMAMERPVVISAGGSAEEIVGREEFGLLMRPEDAFDLQNRLRFLLEHPDERLQMGRRARRHVIKNYDRGFRLRRTLGIYDLALRQRGNI